MPDGDAPPPPPRPPGAGGAPRWLRRWDRMRRPLLLLGGALVVAALVPAFVVREPGALQTALSVGWIGLLLMISALWQPARLRRHEAWVTHMRAPMDDAERFAPYAVAQCGCGWNGPRRQEVEAAFDDAGRHAANVAEDVRRPLG